jgi:hypothetical protein
MMNSFQESVSGEILQSCYDGSTGEKRKDYANANIAKENPVSLLLDIWWLVCEL